MLKKENQIIIIQVVKPKQNPTVKWLLYLFSGIYIWCGLEKEVVLNIKDVHLKTLDLLIGKYKNITFKYRGMSAKYWF